MRFNYLDSTIFFQKVVENVLARFAAAQHDAPLAHIQLLLKIVKELLRLSLIDLEDIDVLRRLAGMISNRLRESNELTTNSDPSEHWLYPTGLFCAIFFIITVLSYVEKVVVISKVVWGVTDEAVLGNVQNLLQELAVHEVEFSRY